MAAAETCWGGFVNSTEPLSREGKKNNPTILQSSNQRSRECLPHSGRVNKREETESKSVEARRYSLAAGAFQSQCSRPGVCLGRLPAGVVLPWGAVGSLVCKGEVLSLAEIPTDAQKRHKCATQINTETLRKEERASSHDVVFIHFTFSFTMQQDTILQMLIFSL